MNEILRGLQAQRDHNALTCEMLDEVIANAPVVLDKLADLNLKVSHVSAFSNSQLWMLLIRFGNERLAHSVAHILNASVKWSSLGEYWSISSSIDRLSVHIDIHPDATCKIEYADKVVKRAVGVKCQPTEV